MTKEKTFFRKKIPGRLSAPAKYVLLIIPVLSALIALCSGRVIVSPADTLKAVVGLFGEGFEMSEQITTVINTIRLPRIILAAFVGAGLSVSGCAFQSLFSNPLATPDTLGAAGGASFGAALGIFMGFDALGIHASAFAFGLCAVVLTWISGAKLGRGMSSVVLSGIMISSLFSALVSLVKFVADSETQLPAITYFLMGSLNGAGFSSIFPGILIIAAGILVLYIMRWRLNILVLSDEEAQSTGINLKLTRIITIICSTAVTAASIAMCGQVGWVGLIIPHICRMKFGANHLSIVPASMSLGAAFLILTDTVSRSASVSEIPISVLTAIIGAPFFIFLLRKGKGWQL